VDTLYNRVGINTTTPAHSLDVVGDAHVSGALNSGSIPSPGPIGGATPSTVNATTVTATSFVGPLTGNAATASAAASLASTPTLCTGGQVPTGISASGNAVGCFATTGSGTVQSGSGYALPVYGLGAGTSVGPSPGLLSNANGDLWIQAYINATSLANYSSRLLYLAGNYWDGGNSGQDWWSFQNVFGTGTNPTETLTLNSGGAFGGNPGVHSVSIPYPISTIQLTATGNIITSGGYLETDTGVFPVVAGSGTIGSLGSPFSAVYVGGASTNNIKITGTATASRQATLPDGASGTVLVGAITLTMETSDSLTLQGVTTSSHCTFSPSNSTATTATILPYYSVTANTFTLTHAATVGNGATYGVMCTSI
jgi:hypothetical protein